MVTKRGGDPALTRATEPRIPRIQGGQGTRRRLHQSTWPARISDSSVLFPDTIDAMRLTSLFLVVVLLATTSTAADQPASALPCADGIPGAPSCMVTPQSRQDAHRAFALGMKLQKQKRLDEALVEFEKAATLVPQDLQYATLRQLVRQQVIKLHQGLIETLLFLQLHPERESPVCVLAALGSHHAGGSAGNAVGAGQGRGWLVGGRAGSGQQHDHQEQGCQAHRVDCIREENGGI